MSTGSSSVASHDAVERSDGSQGPVEGLENERLGRSGLRSGERAQPATASRVSSSKRAKHDHAPVVATKNIVQDVKEGTIYYRYVGETRAINELRQIIARREQRAVAEFTRPTSPEFAK